MKSKLPLTRCVSIVESSLHCRGVMGWRIWLQVKLRRRRMDARPTRASGL